MGCTYGFTTLIGVELASEDDLIETKYELKRGCEHKVNKHKFCPECGSLARREVEVKIPRIELPEDWRWNVEKKSINDRYHLYYDNAYRKVAKIVISIYYHFLESEEMNKQVELSQEELEEYFGQAEEMIQYLKEHNITPKTDKPRVFVLPYLSC